jgi:hypothetical protein
MIIEVPRSLKSSLETLPCSYFTDEMDQTPPARSEPLVSGIRTPPVRRNSKLATLGRIFKPWKWRKKKNEKLKQTTSGKALVRRGWHKPGVSTPHRIASPLWLLYFTDCPVGSAQGGAHTWSTTASIASCQSGC